MPKIKSVPYVIQIKTFLLTEFVIFPINDPMKKTRLLQTVLLIILTLLITTCKKKQEENGAISGTSISQESKMYKTTVNLRIRKDYHLESDIIATLPEGTEVRMLEEGPYETINNIYNKWVKVSTIDNVTGWCFGGYIEEYNPNDTHNILYKIFLYGKRLTTRCRMV